MAEYLRLRHHRLRVTAPYSAQTKALRTAVRTREDLVGMRVAAANQLAALLETWWPGTRSLFADIESPIALEFLARYPTPASAARLGEGRMAAFCARQHYSGRRSAAELTGRLRAAAPGTSEHGIVQAAADIHHQGLALERMSDHGGHGKKPGAAARSPGSSRPRSSACAGRGTGPSARWPGTST
jgi:hypothetical protein